MCREYRVTRRMKGCGPLREGREICPVAQAGESSTAAAGALHAVVGYGGGRLPVARAKCTIRGMTTRFLLSVALGLTLGGNLLAQEPGDPDCEPNPDTVDEYERLGEEERSDYELDGEAFDEAADQAGAQRAAGGSAHRE